MSQRFLIICQSSFAYIGFLFCQVNRRSLAAAADEFGSSIGGRVWRSLVRRLQEMGALFGAISNQIGPLDRVYLVPDSD